MIDILMSTYNGARFLKPQLDSILSQSYKDFRLIIRDDGSADDTMRILEEYAIREPRIRLSLDSIGKLGARQSFMKLIENAGADYFMLSDQDDVWLPEKIDKTRELMLKMEAKNGSEVPLLVFTDLTVTDENLETIDTSLWNYQKLDPLIYKNWRNLLAQNVVTGCAILGNRAAASASLPFALPEMMHDHWIAVNVAKYGRIEYLPEPTVLYRQHNRNVEGGKQFGIGYAAKRLPEFIQKIGERRRAAAHFGNITTLGIIVRKSLLNLRRFTIGG